MIMAFIPSNQLANTRCLKRTFTTATLSPPPSPERASTYKSSEARGRKLRQRGHSTRNTSEGRETLRFAKNMPTTAGPRIYENQIPSFMSVYDMDSSTIERPGVDPPAKAAPTYLSQHLQNRTLDQSLPTQEHEFINPQLQSHQHRESTSTQASDSTDSSPTTTISTVDSSSLSSDPSPSSSPESPVTLVPLSSFPGSSFGLDSFQSLKMTDTPLMRLPLNEGRPMTSPGPRRFKNLKSLALNLSTSPENSGASEPSSPSFIKPPPLAGRRKPSLLSLNTGAANSEAVSTNGLASPGLPGLSSMLQRRGLKHSISSPQMLSTPGFGPQGGMTLGERNLPRLGVPRLVSNLGGNTFTIDEGEGEPLTAGPQAQMATRVPGVAVGGDSFDRPQSGEEGASVSYPDGPILMHEPNVHLYLEPKLEEAMKFDVIINVAREVKNPFKEMEARKEEGNREIPSTASSDSKTIVPGDQDLPPDTAASMMSFQTAFEVQPPRSSESSPTTPKPAVEQKLPEYIHMPWDHNTDVKDELWDLCQTIEERVNEGKKVLVHCQQGASRSATLIIAYLMYTNRDLQATDAHKLAQAKSPWVNPNMSLLFSLNDFKKILDQKKKSEKPTSSEPKHRPTVLTTNIPERPISRARGNSTPSSTTRENALAILEDRKQSTSVCDTATKRFADFDFGFGSSFTMREPEKEKENMPLRKESHFEEFLEKKDVIPAPRTTFGFEDIVPSKAENDPSHSAFGSAFGDASFKERNDSVHNTGFGFGDFSLPLQEAKTSYVGNTEFGGFTSTFELKKETKPSHHMVAAPRPLDLHQSNSNDWDDILSPREVEMTGVPFARSFHSEPPVAEPETPALFSPRVFEFPRQSFFATLQPSMPAAEDPRSPPTHLEAPITRSIDDFL